MYSKSHLAISAAIGLVVAFWMGATPARFAFLVAYAAVVGTAIDLDHFVIARARTGGWSNLRFVLSNPRAAFVEQDRIFEEGDVGALTRLGSHVVVGTVLVAVVGAFDPPLGLLTALVLAAHVASDLVADAPWAGGEPQSS